MTEDERIEMLYGKTNKPMTNADRIRAMTDEELADFMTDIKLRAFKYFGHTGDYDEIVESNLEWLKQECES